MSDKNKSCRLGKVGGQALLEGVMMKNVDSYAVALRMPEGNIKVVKKEWTSIKDRHKILNIPIIRGLVNFIESLKLSFTTLMLSTETFGLEDEEESKFEKWLREKFGKSILDFVMVISTVIGIGLGIGIFFFLPLLVSQKASGGTTKWYSTIIEGLIKMGIFVLYIWAVSFMKDIKRTFQYHGAEHKSIACYESGDELTPENAKKHTRFHPRCGTSFVFVMLLLSILVYALVYMIPVMRENLWLKFGSKLIILPLIVGLGYEFIRYAGRHDNVIVKIFSFPGLLMQRLTTKEPDLEQLEVAIYSLKVALSDEFPEAQTYLDESKAYDERKAAEREARRNGVTDTGAAPTDAPSDNAAGSDGPVPANKSEEERPATPEGSDAQNG